MATIPGLANRTTTRRTFCQRSREHLQQDDGEEEEEDDDSSTDEEDDPELPAGCQEGILNTLIQEMREERQQSQAQFKSIPQVQPMHAREFEDTQRARGNHKGNWVHTLSTSNVKLW